MVSRTDKTRPYKVRVNDPLEERMLFEGEWWLIHCHSHYRSCPRWFRKSVWWAPQRMHERKNLNAMRKEYNSHGRLEDDDFVNLHHKHTALWAWF